jgi:hypothetical protein
MSEKERPSDGKLSTRGGSAPEMTDEQIRDLVAQADGKPFLSQEEEDAVLARFDERLKKRGIGLPNPKC